MNKIPCSVGILTFNSAQTLKRALESVREFDDIIICDGGSTDDTLNIARAFSARIIAQDAKYKNVDNTLRDYGGVRNQCLDTAKYDWFLYIDSDETISDSLREDIRHIIKDRSSKSQQGRSLLLAYRVPIGIMMDGRYIKYSSNYPGYQYRFFNKKSGARFVKVVHERIAFDEKKVKISTLAHPWYIHTTRNDWLHYLAHSKKYCTNVVVEACTEPIFTYLHYTVWWHLRASAAVILKSFYNYSAYGFSDTLPVRGELGRATAPLVHIWRVTACRLKRFFA